jgi:protein gp37
MLLMCLVLKNWPIAPNLWLGVTVCNPDEKLNIDKLRQIPAAHRWVSFEPLLADIGELNLEGIDWVVVGAESGPKARHCEMRHILNIVKQCTAAGVPVFVKQLHLCVPAEGDFRLSKDPSEWPEDLRLRQKPKEFSKDAKANAES